MKNKKTTHAILGLLSTRPLSGYEIKKNIDESIGNFWNESYGQIYPILKNLHEEGYVTKETRQDSGKREVYEYSITDDGMEYLQEWLEEDYANENVRIEFLLKIFFGANTNKSVIEKHIIRFEQEKNSKIQQLQHIEKALEEHKDNPHYPYWIMSVRYGLKINQSLLDWIKETKETLENI